ncbi:MAG: hypothetical protein ACI39U_04310, partial [Candidatus Cryptobacteroides sp.]
MMKLHFMATQFKKILICSLTAVLLFNCGQIFAQPADTTGQGDPVPTEQIVRKTVTPNNGHSLKLAVGDQLFENLVWQNPQKINNMMPESYRETYKERYRYTCHWSLEYQWRVNSWFSVGALVDGSACFWDDVLRNGAGTELSRTKNRFFANLTIMPTLRFDWFTLPVGEDMTMGMYTALGVGLDINGGTEYDLRGRRVVTGLAVDLRLISLEYTVGHWGVNLELGGLTAIRDK